MEVVVISGLRRPRTSMNIMKKTYALVNRECLPSMKTQLERAEGYIKEKKDQDMVELLKLNRSFSSQHYSNTQVTSPVIQFIK